MQTDNKKISSSIIIDQNTANQRLDRFLRKYFRPYPDISLVMIFKAIRTGQIKIQTSPSFPLPASQDISSQINPLQGQRDDHKTSTKVKESYMLKTHDTIVFHQSFLDLLSNKNPVEKRERVPL